MLEQFKSFNGNKASEPSGFFFWGVVVFMAANNFRFTKVHYDIGQSK